MHVIRLRSFWDTQATDDGRFCHRRRFGKPTNLDVDEHVWLLGEPRAEPDSLRLNGEWLGTLKHFAFDITSRLVSRNELILVSTSETPPEELRLEIRATSHP